MRIWLNPDKIAARNLTASDVVNAIREQNVQVAGGVIRPAARSAAAGELRAAGQAVKGRLVSEEEFGNIIIKTGLPETAKRRFRSRTWPASNLGP